MNSLPTVSVLVALTFVTGILLIYPFRRRVNGSQKSGQMEFVVYRDQLKELERDRSMGLLSEEQAGYIRAEIARRVFAANDNLHKEEPRLASRPLTLGAMLLIVGSSFFLYLLIGRPELPSHAPDTAASLRGSPLVAARGIAVAGVNRGDSNVAKTSPPADADSLNSMAEMLLSLSGGRVTEDAKKIFERSLVISPENPRARFYLALYAEQTGKELEARAAFKTLAQDAPADAPWLSVVKEHILKNGGTIDDAAYASNQRVSTPGTTTTSDQMQMVRSMVASLDSRLSGNSADLEGWLRLVRSYAVLGEDERAADALRRGLSAFPSTGEEGQRLVKLSNELGIATEGLNK